MKYRNCLFILAFFVLASALPPLTYSQGRVTSSRQGTNRVEGTVVDPSNKPVYNAYIELYNDIGALVDRQRSSTQGRFSFKGMGPGNYVVQVKPFGTNLREDHQEIEINNQTTGSDFVMVSFRLRNDNRYSSNEISIVGTVFAQEVPDNAKKLYNSGVSNLSNNREKAVANFEEAIEIFPTYFDALAALGKAHVLNGGFEKGYPILLKAIDVNPKCSDCFYSLALAFYKLNEIAAGLKAIDAAAVLSPQTPVIRLLQGILHRLNNDFTEAEKALLMAKSLYKEPNAEIHWQLSMVYNRTKRNQEAADELETYLKVKPDVDSAEKRNIRSLISKLRAAK